MPLNTTAAGSFMKPAFTEKLPAGLTLTQFIQAVLTGISCIPGPLVRPKWQPDPPKNPDGTVNWISFGIEESKPDANGYLGMNADEATVYQRRAELEIQVQIYGPEAMENADLIRDGFQIPQNLQALTKANMGLKEVGPARHLPDLVNGKFINRMIMSVFIRREVQRIYPILSIVSASGTIHTVVGDEDYLSNWQAPEGS